MIKQFSINTLCNCLMSLPIKPSILICKHKQILMDEEFIEENKIKKCYCCESTNIKTFNAKSIYLLQEKIKQLGIIPISLRLFDIDLNVNNLNVEYCDDCKKMLSCNDELLILDINFSENELFDIMVDEGTIDKKGIPLECPYCNNHKFVHKNVYCDEISEVEYDEVCNKCGHPLMHFAYGQREILPF